MRQRSSIVQPWTIAPWPMVTSSPMLVEWVPLTCLVSSDQ
jgi:hypothetical protein